MTKTEIHLLGLIMLYLSVRSLGYLGVGGGGPLDLPLWLFLAGSYSFNLFLSGAASKGSHLSTGVSS